MLKMSRGFKKRLGNILIGYSEVNTVDWWWTFLCMQRDCLNWQRSYKNHEHGRNRNWENIKSIIREILCIHSLYLSQRGGLRRQSLRLTCFICNHTGIHWILPVRSLSHVKRRGLTGPETSAKGVTLCILLFQHQEIMYWVNPGWHSAAIHVFNIWTNTRYILSILHYFHMAGPWGWACWCDIQKLHHMPFAAVLVHCNLANSFPSLHGFGSLATGNPKQWLVLHWSKIWKLIRLDIMPVITPILDYNYICTSIQNNVFANPDPIFYCKHFWGRNSFGKTHWVYTFSESCDGMQP